MDLAGWKREPAVRSIDSCAGIEACPGPDVDGNRSIRRGQPQHEVGWKGDAMPVAAGKGARVEAFAASNQRLAISGTFHPIEENASQRRCGPAIARADLS